MSALAKAHERTFGVEIECGHDRSYTHVAEEMRRAGYQMGYYTDGGWSIGADGSGVEVRTPILQGKEGFRQLKGVFKFLNDLGCYITTRDGMHVHHGAPELINNPELCLRLIRAYVANRDDILAMVAPERRRGGVYSPSTPALVEQLEQYVVECQPRPNPRYRPYSRFTNEQQQFIVTTPDSRRMPIQDGRGDVSLYSLRQHGTIEWRLHEGCLNYDQAEAWIMFCQKFMHRAIGSKTPITASSRAELLQRIRLTKKQREVIDDKITRSDFPPRGGYFVNGR